MVLKDVTIGVVSRRLALSFLHLSRALGPRLGSWHASEECSVIVRASNSKLIFVSNFAVRPVATLFGSPLIHVLFDS